MFEYKVVVYREGLLGSIFLGQSKVDPKKFSAFLNHHGQEGWDVTTMERDIRRQLLFFRVESYVVILKRKKTESENRETQDA